MERAHMVDIRNIKKVIAYESSEYVKKVCIAAEK